MCRKNQINLDTKLSIRCEYVANAFDNISMLNKAKQNIESKIDELLCVGYNYSREDMRTKLERHYTNKIELLLTVMN